MPASEAPVTVKKPKGPAETSHWLGIDEAEISAAELEAREQEPAPSTGGTSRWVDYDTHELLQMISELEDERRWARLREGIWLAILIHIILISAITWIPKYVFRVPPVIDPFDAIKQRKDLTYLDMPPDALREIQPKVARKPAPEKLPPIDKKTLEALNRPTPEQAAPPPPPPVDKTPEVKPQPTQPIPPVAKSPVEAPRPAAVPVRPNFAMESQNPADQLREAMRGAARNPGTGSVGSLGPGGLTLHPGAGSGGVQVLSDTQGVDFTSWLQRWHWETERTWDPLIPDEVNPPINKAGMVAIEFKVLPNGRLMDGSVHLVGRSGDTALDRAAWGALTGSSYPPLPRAFHGPYLELRAYFLYNMQPPQ
ncbi:MAG: energy transducer TonB [Acidobacteriota bacterium]|nr:energy transducer TonB [Acidobacteriota bacterium]